MPYAKTKQASGVCLNCGEPETRIKKIDRGGNCWVCTNKKCTFHIDLANIKTWEKIN